jgi:hypothetical protein
MINNTDPFLGFDITLNSSDISKLKPYAVDPTGSIMPSGSSILAECVGGLLVIGSTCASTDNPSTVHLAIVGPFGFLTSPGTTGLLFTAIFSITGTTPIGGVKISYQNGCPTSSSGNLCVAFTNGTKILVTESTRTGSFDNSSTATLPYATLTTPTINLGVSLAGTPTYALPSVTFTATSQNGFNTTGTATVNLAAAFNGTGIRPTVLLSAPFVDLTGVPRRTFTQTGSVASNVPAGVFVATVTATYQTMDMLTFTTSSLSASYSLPVNVTDYTINANPTLVAIQPPASKPSTVTIAPKSVFNTPVKLGVTIPAATAAAGIGATFNTYTISGGSGTSTLTISTTTSTPGGTFTLTINSNATLNGFTKSHAVTLTIKTVGFTITASSPAPLNIGNAEMSTITVTYLNGFAGTIALTNNTVTNLSCQAITPLSVSGNRTATISCVSQVAGSYSLTITSSGVGLTSSTTVTFTFAIQTHDVAIASTSINPSGQVTVGMNVTVTVKLQNKGPATEYVVVSLIVGGTVTVATQNVTVLGNASKNVTLIWNTSKSAANKYTLTVQIQLSNGETNTESNSNVLSQDIGTANLQPAQGSSTFDTTTLAIIAVVVVAAAAGSLLIIRRRRTPSDISQPGTQ